MKVSLYKRNEKPLTDRGMRIDYGEPKRKGYRWQRYLIAALIIVPFLFVSWRLAVNVLVVELNGQVILEEEEVLAPEDGSFTPFVVEKTTVQPDTPLGVLTVRPLQPQPSPDRTAEEAALARQRADVNSRMTLAREHETLQAKELATYQNLFQQGAATRAELNSVQAQYQAAHRERVLLENEQKSLDIQNPVPANNVALEAKVTLYSSAGGIVEEAPLQPEWVARGTVLFRLKNPLVTPKLFVYLEPKDIAYVRDGERVDLMFSDEQRVQGRLDLKLMAAIQRSWQQSKSGFEQSNLLLRAEVQLDAPLPEPLCVNGLPFTVRLGWRVF